MKNYEVIAVEECISFHLTAEVLAEYMEDKFESQFGFRPMLQPSEDEGYLEVYLHTDTYETLYEEELTKLDELGITESDSLDTICTILNLKIETGADNHKEHDDQSGKKYRRLGKIMRDELVSEIDCSPFHTNVLEPKKATVSFAPFTKMVKQIKQCLRIKSFSFSR